MGETTLHFLLGILYARCSHIFTAQQLLTNYPCKNISSFYAHCVPSQDGILNLDCFSEHQYNRLALKCFWNPKVKTSKETYIFTFEQSNLPCKFVNTSEKSVVIHSFYKGQNVTAHIIDESDAKKCTMAVFQNQPQTRCGQNLSGSFSRYSRQLNVMVSWTKEESKHIKQFSVRYKALSSQSWKEANATKILTVGNLTSSLHYEVQIHCVSNSKCYLCPWSKTFIIPPELNDMPIFETLDCILRTIGRRRLIIRFKLATGVQGFKVTLRKDSRESPPEEWRTMQLELSLILSYSTYHLNITAFNNVSTSPAAMLTIPPLDDTGISVGTIKVTFIDKMLFRVSWLDNLTQNYGCFAVEWRRRGQRATYQSFYENQNKYEDIHLDEPLKPFTRYIFTLLSWPNKPPCNLRHLNNSESTYGSVQAYFSQGAPNKAPSNILSSNVTQTSMVLEWSALPEENLRGFLQGYLIRFEEIPPAGSSVENGKYSTKITVGPNLTRHALVNLTRGAVYQVQMSAFTCAGVGVWSLSAYFETKSSDYPSLHATTAGFAVLTLTLLCMARFHFPWLNRVKMAFWPSIPNPGNSNATQNITGKLMGPIIQRQEDSNISHVLERTTQTVPGFSLFTESLLYGTESDKHPDSCLRSKNADDLSECCCCGDQGQGSIASTPQIIYTKGKHSSNPGLDATHHTGPEPNQALDLQGGTFVFHDDYTTMECFQQLLPQCLSERERSIVVNKAPKTPLEESDLMFTKNITGVYAPV